MGWIDDFLESTGLNIFGDAINSLGDSLGITQHGRDQYFQREMTYDMMNSQQDFQREMFGLSSDFAREQTANQQNFTREMYQRMLQNYPELLRMQNASQFNLWRQQFQMQNDYNSPSAQVQRMLSAGINPNSVFGGSGTIATSQMSPSSLGTPQISPTPFNSQSFGSQGSPIGLPSGYLGNRKDMLSSMGSFLRDYSEMQLNQKKAGRYDEAMDAQIKEALAKAGLDVEKNNYQKLITEVDSFMLPRKKASEVKLNFALAAKYAAEEDEAKSQEYLNYALADLNDTKNKEAKSRLPFIEMEISAEIDDIRASAAEKRAAAAEARQRTETERYNTRIAEIRADTDAKTQFAKITTLLNDLRKQRVLNVTEIKEARLKYKRLEDILNRRDNGLFMRYADEFLTWFTGHIGVAINGNAGVSSVTKHE